MVYIVRGSEDEGFLISTHPPIARASYRRTGLQEVGGKACSSVLMDWWQSNTVVLAVSTPREPLSRLSSARHQSHTSTRVWVFNLQPYGKEAGKVWSVKKYCLTIDILCGKNTDLTSLNYWDWFKLRLMKPHPPHLPWRWLEKKKKKNQRVGEGVSDYPGTNTGPG